MDAAQARTGLISCCSARRSDCCSMLGQERQIRTQQLACCVCWLDGHAAHSQLTALTFSSHGQFLGVCAYSHLQKVILCSRKVAGQAETLQIRLAILNNNLAQLCCTDANLTR